MIIDFHTHAYPDKVAQKALNNLQQNYGVIFYTDGTYSALRQSMKEAGVDISVVLPIASRLGNNPSLNNNAKAICSEDLISFGSVFPEEPEVFKQIDYAWELGLKGLKFHPDFQEFYFSDKHIIDVISYALDKGFIVTVHVGIDPALRDLVYSTPQMVKHLVDKVNSEKLVLAHLGGHLYWDEVLEYVAGSNCYLDTALVTGAINPQKLKKIMDKHGYDRILYGSDSPYGSQKISVDTITGLKLLEDNIDKIMYKNALKLLGL